MLVSDLILQSMLDLGAIAAGDALTTLEQTDAFTRLNQIVKSVSTEELTVPSKTHTGFAMVANQTAYTLGVGGGLVTAGRPLRVTGAESVSLNFRGPVEVMSFERFNATVSDPLGSTSVLALKLAADGSFPLINLKVFPVPAVSPGVLWLDYWMAVAAFATVGDTIALPEGWELFLRRQLAVDLYPQYARAGQTLDALAGLAQAAKSSLVALNQSILGTQAAA